MPSTPCLPERPGNIPRQNRPAQGAGLFSPSKSPLAFLTGFTMPRILGCGTARNAPASRGKGLFTQPFAGIRSNTRGLPSPRTPLAFCCLFFSFKQVFDSLSRPAQGAGLFFRFSAAAAEPPPAKRRTAALKKAQPGSVQHDGVDGLHQLHHIGPADPGEGLAVHNGKAFAAITAVQLNPDP